MRVFITGASGWIGSAVVPELLGAGHQVVGLARSDASAGALTAAGAEVERGDLDDLDALARIAAASDGVIHLAFKHELAFTGDFAGAADADRQAVEVIGEALAGTDRPFLLASGVLGLKPGRLATEADGREPDPSDVELPVGPDARRRTAQFTLSLASRGVRAVVVRLAPTCHGEGDNGFMAILAGVARTSGIAGYVGDGSQRWPAAHRFDVAHLFCLALEQAPAGSVVHAVAEEGVAIRAVAEAMGRQLDIPVQSIAPDDAFGHFGFLAGFLGTDSPVSSALTRELVGWEPTHPGLIEDIDLGHYFRETSTA